MSAFNRRLQPKEIFGMPFLAAVGGVFFLVFGVLALLLPLALKILTVPLAIGGAVMAVIAIFFGDDLPFLPLMWRGRFLEAKRVTSETWTRE
jgi:hypothetical protein